MAFKPSKPQCKNHPDENLIEDHHDGVLICPKCGLVVDNQVISNEAEWNSYNADVQSRVGGRENHLLSSAMNLGTSILRNSNRGTSSPFSTDILKQYDRRSHDKLLVHTFKTIEEMAARIDLPKVVIDRAQYLYKKIIEHRHLKGNLLMCDIKPAACVYIACQQENCPRTPQEISAISESSAQNILYTSRKISCELKIKENKIIVKDLLPRFCSRLQLSKQALARAIQIESNWQQVKDREFNPKTIAASSIYMAIQSTHEASSEKDICESTGVSLVSLRNSVQIMMTKLMP